MNRRRGFEAIMWVLTAALTLLLLAGLNAFIEWVRSLDWVSR